MGGFYAGLGSSRRFMRIGIAGWALGLCAVG